MIWALLDQRITLDHLGYIPYFFSEEDPRSAREQINSAYISGWHPMQGFTLQGDTLQYPGDPPMRPIAMASLRDETIFIYPYAWVMIVNGKDWEVSRID